MTGYLPPKSLLETQKVEEEGEEEDEDMSAVEIDISSILKSESDDESSRNSRYSDLPWFAACFLEVVTLSFGSDFRSYPLHHLVSSFSF